MEQLFFLQGRYPVIEDQYCHFLIWEWAKKWGVGGISSPGISSCAPKIEIVEAMRTYFQPIYPNAEALLRVNVLEPKKKTEQEVTEYRLNECRATSEGPVKIYWIDYKHGEFFGCL